LTHEAQNNPGNAMKTVRLSLLCLGGLGLIFGLAIFLGAPLLVRIVLGSAFQDSVPVLRVFALWIPLTGLVTVITFQLLLPNQLDNQFNIVNFTSALVGIAAAVLLAPKFSAVGIAWSAVIAQAYTVVAFSVILGRAGLNPFARSTAAHPSPAAVVLPVPSPPNSSSKGARGTGELASIPYVERQRIS
jgi:PST family polysaccharide transporter